MGCTARALVPKQARGTFSKKFTKPFSQPVYYSKTSKHFCRAYSCSGSRLLLPSSEVDDDDDDEGVLLRRRRRLSSSASILASSLALSAFRSRSLSLRSPVFQEEPPEELVRPSPPEPRWSLARSTSGLLSEGRINHGVTTATGGEVKFSIRRLPFMMSTAFCDFSTLSPSFCPQNLFLFVHKFAAFLDPLPPSLQKSYMEAP